MQRMRLIPICFKPAVVWALGSNSQPTPPASWRSRAMSSPPVELHAVGLIRMVRGESCPAAHWLAANASVSASRHGVKKRHGCESNTGGAPINFR